MIAVEKEAYLLEPARYVVLNPVRAGAARSAHDWPWSGYRATAGTAEALELLTASWLLKQFHRTPDRAAQPYRNFVKQGRSVDA